MGQLRAAAGVDCATLAILGLSSLPLRNDAAQLSEYSRHTTHDLSGIPGPQHSTSVQICEFLFSSHLFEGEKPLKPKMIVNLYPLSGLPG